MNKKIISTFVLLLILISATLVFFTFNQSESDGKSEDYTPIDDFTDDDLSNEIDDYFISEDDDVDIGDMI